MPGPAQLPIHDSPFGRLSGAICFDLDHAHYALKVREALVLRFWCLQCAPQLVISKWKLSSTLQALKSPHHAHQALQVREVLQWAALSSNPAQSATRSLHTYFIHRRMLAVCFYGQRCALSSS